jgi:hypothetical protein
MNNQDANNEPTVIEDLAVMAEQQGEVKGGIVPSDNIWRGPVTLGTSNTAKAGSNTYRGTTTVDNGILN